uniref:Uncharacterized protein n=1 Tax=Oryza brachyantha TaxID=4533 RepID=J3LBA6_ORYBR
MAAGEEVAAAERAALLAAAAATVDRLVWCGARLRCGCVRMGVCALRICAFSLDACLVCSVSPLPRGNGKKERARGALRGGWGISRGRPIAGWTVWIRDGFFFLKNALLPQTEYLREKTNLGIKCFYVYSSDLKVNAVK